jgi:hypothetical protein
VGTSKFSVVETNVSQSAGSKASLAEVGLMAPSHERGFQKSSRALEEAGVVEILESGLDAELGQRLLVPEKMLLAVMHSDNVGRAMRMLSVAIGHKAVKCVFATDQDRTDAASDACPVVHLHVDMPEAMLLHVLQKSRVEDSPTSLPKNACLTTCLRSAGAGP